MSDRESDKRYYTRSERREQTTSSFHLRWKCYLRITRKTAHFVGAVSIKWERDCLSSHSSMRLRHKVAHMGISRSLALDFNPLST